MFLRTCARCSATFETVRTWARYCHTCRVILDREHNRASYHRHAAANRQRLVECRGCGSLSVLGRYRYCEACRAGVYCPRCHCYHKTACPTTDRVWARRVMTGAIR